MFYDEKKDPTSKEKETEKSLHYAQLSDRVPQWPHIRNCSALWASLCTMEDHSFTLTLALTLTLTLTLTLLHRIGSFFQ